MTPTLKSVATARQNHMPKIAHRRERVVAAEIKAILADSHGKFLSLNQIMDCLRGNPMIDADSTTADAARLIGNHVEDEK
jgi:hypothetical protein